MARRRKKGFPEHELSRRERQIMGAVYRLEQASVAEIVRTIPDPPTPDAVRRMCHILVEKGLLRAESDGTRNLFHPTVEAGEASRAALENVLDTYFRGSPQMLVAALLDARRGKLSKEDVRRLNAMIAAAEKKGRSR